MKLNIPEMCHMFHQEIGRSGVSIISKELKPKKKNSKPASVDSFQDCSQWEGCLRRKSVSPNEIVLEMPSLL